MANSEDVVVKFRADVSESISEMDRMKQSVVNTGKAVEQTNTKIQASTKKTVSSFNGLGNSINQLSRELPAFAVSANVGFLALSNNIPMLADQITMLKAKNLELVASGQKSIPVWKSVTTALLSWQTALSVGVTLITIYGSKIVDWIGSLFESEKAVKINTFAQKEYNKVLEEANKILTTNQELINRKSVSNLSDKRQTSDLRKETENQLHILEDRELKAVAFIKNTDSYRKYAQLQNALDSKNLSVIEIANLTYQKAREKDLIEKAFKTKTGFTNKELEAEQKRLRDILKGLPVEEKARASANEKQIAHLTEYENLLKKIADLELVLNNEILSGQVSDKTVENLFDYKNLLNQITDEYERIALANGDVVKMETKKIEKIKESNIELGIQGEKLKVATDNAESFLDVFDKVTPLIMDISNNIAQITSNMTQTQIDGVDAYEKAQIESLDRLLEKKTISEDEYQKRRAKIEKKADVETLKLKREQAEREKIIATFQATIQGALAILKVSGEPFLLPLTIAAVATQIAAIQTAPIPQFEDGGHVKGKRHSQGGVLAELEDGEFVNKRKSVSLYREYLEGANDLKLKEVINKNDVIPALRKQREKILSNISSNFNDGNILNSDRETRGVLRDIYKEIKKGKQRNNLRFKNV